MDYLRCHEPISHVLRQKTHCFVGVQLSVGEDPEDYEQDSRDALGCNEVGCVGLDVAFLRGRMGYLIAKQHELTENGEGFQVLREGPQIISNERSVERRMED